MYRFDDLVFIDTQGTNDTDNPDNSQVY